MGIRSVLIGTAMLAALAVQGAAGQPVPDASSTTTTVHESATDSTTTPTTPSTTSTLGGTSEVQVPPYQRCEIARVLAEKELTACRAARALAEQDALLRVMAEQAATEAGVHLEAVDYDAARGVFRPRETWSASTTE